MSSRDNGFPAIPNFRDAGGHALATAGRMRCGLLYRSVALDVATDEDLAILEGLGIGTVFDMRTPHEQEERPDRLPAGAELVSLNVMADDGDADYPAVAAHLHDPEDVALTLGAADMLRFNVDTYRDFIRLVSARASYEHLFRRLADDESAALVHCAGGKDRTGWAVAALQLFLGVPYETVVADYLVSHDEVQAFFGSVIDDFVTRGGRREVVEAMLSARPEFLASAVETAEMDHGSMEAYFRDGLRLDEETLERLRNRFTEEG